MADDVPIFIDHRGYLQGGREGQLVKLGVTVDDVVDQSGKPALLHWCGTVVQFEGPPNARAKMYIDMRIAVCDLLFYQIRANTLNYTMRLCFPMEKVQLKSVVAQQYAETSEQTLLDIIHEVNGQETGDPYMVPFPCSASTMMLATTNENSYSYQLHVEYDELNASTAFDAFAPRTWAQMMNKDGGEASVIAQISARLTREGINWTPTATHIFAMLEQLIYGIALNTWNNARVPGCWPTANEHSMNAVDSAMRSLRAFCLNGKNALAARAQFLNETSAIVAVNDKHADAFASAKKLAEKQNGRGGGRGGFRGGRGRGGWNGGNGRGGGGGGSGNGQGASVTRN